MAAHAILLSDFTDSRFHTAFQKYFAELKIHVSDWDALFREMDEEDANLAYFLLDEDQTLGFLIFQVTSFSNWFFEEPFGFIREFWIDPAYRRRGHGRTLLRLAETYLLEHGAYRAILTSDDAAAFYLASGYRKAPGVSAKNHMTVFVKSL